MQELAQKSPNSAPDLEGLPSHVIDHLGKIATGLTHVDMHPNISIQQEGLSSELQKDFEQVITDPEFDSSALAEEAIVAAEAGELEKSELLNGTAEAMQSAHQELVDSGYMFGPQAEETDSERQSRQWEERQAIYEGAASLALEEANSAIQAGDRELAAKKVEQIVFLSSVNMSTGKKFVVEAIHCGLIDEVVTACQKSDNLVRDQGSSRVSSYLHSLGMDTLVGMASGKKYDEHFREAGEFNLGYQPLIEDREIIAIATAKQTAFTVDDAIQAFPNRVVVQSVLGRVDKSLNDDQPNSAEYMYSFIKAAPPNEDISYALKTAQPLEAQQIANRLGEPIYSIVSMFGRTNPEDPKSLLEVDVVAAEGMASLKQTHPEHFAALMHAAAIGKLKTGPDQGGGISFDPSQIEKTIGELQSVGINDTELTAFVAGSQNPQEVASFCLEVTSQLRKLGLTNDQLMPLLQKSGLTPWQAFSLEQKAPDEAAKLAQNLACRSEIFDLYMAEYDQQEYPFVKEKSGRELDNFPHIQSRLLDLGISEDLASGMFKSWTTYKAFVKAHYRNEEFSFPDEKPDQAFLENIAHDQVNALMSQLEAVESFNATYGKDVLNSVINNFGIYNFSRHRADQLAEQNAAWHAGVPASTVVVEARSDWNSFTGKHVRFEEEQGQGVFYFEANSGADAARIAIRIGQRERANGREPNVRRFILHAHGNSTGMLMGVNGETIETSDYLKAAKQAGRIGEVEVNDYTRHLGPNFEVILQSCSTAGETPGDRNIADTMSDEHNAKILASKVTITGLKIQKDGSVLFETNEGDGEPIIYDGR